ncbi:hypothetical protein OG883_45815 [Streptomyces sp. NBC_01142]|uniref:hypothetical protein n=1 Tax=Streptomyces sp. NBC_01142 TaxID=2975865 RepID=UPI00225BD558|nr:hypothetical protein [Streptomyces sp. NBC_01142]MCX4826958.1 hypothetical protein [Streptomyces sp. NBC_01142]
MPWNNVVDVLLFAALALGALCWALDLGTHRSRLVFLTCVVGAITLSAVLQSKDWCVVAIYGVLLGINLSALRRESVRRKSATTTTSRT